MAVLTLAYDAGTDLGVGVDGYENASYSLAFFPEVADYALGYNAANQDGREFRKGYSIGRQQGRATGYDEGFEEGAASGRLTALAAGRVTAPTAAADIVPPVIAAVSPTPNTTPGTIGAFPNNYAIAKDVEVVLDVTDLVPGLQFVAVHALFLDGTTEPVYLGSSFVSGYVSNSYQETITNGKRLHIRRDASWPGAPKASTNLAVGLMINAIDKAGNVATSTLYWQMPVEVVVSPVVAETIETTAADITAEILELVVWQFHS